MIRIILIGYMGAGKTTVGRQLALALGCSFYDLDWYIEMRYHRTVAQLFAERGEEGFREFYDNMQYLNAQGETIYLKVEPATLAQHLEMGKVERPLIKGKTKEDLVRHIQESLRQREHFYLQAKHVVDVTLLDNYEKIKDSVKLLREELGV